MKRLNLFVNAIRRIANDDAIIHISKKNVSRPKENARIDIALHKSAILKPIA
jgi:hypothetical protein